MDESYGVSCFSAAYFKVLWEPWRRLCKEQNTCHINQRKVLNETDHATKILYYSKSYITGKTVIKDATMKSLRSLTAPFRSWRRLLIPRTTELHTSLDVCDSVMNLSSAWAIIFVVLQSIESDPLQRAGSLCMG